MQIKKDEIRERILRSAQREFLRHGFSKASLRVIAAQAGLSRGGIYPYFDSKDHLFCELVSPALDFLDAHLNQTYQDDDFEETKNVLFSYEKNAEEFQRHAHAVLTLHPYFKLLLFCSDGSSLSDIHEMIIQQYTSNFHRYLKQIAKAHIIQNNQISEMFIHTLTSTYISFLKELVLHEPERSALSVYIQQITVFMWYGMNNLMGNCGVMMEAEESKRETSEMGNEPYRSLCGLEF